MRYRAPHAEPGPFRQNYIILPYGMYYDKTKGFLNAKKGDTIRLFKGREFYISSAKLIEGEDLCDVLCRVRYGMPWYMVLKQWQRYAVMEGNGKAILSTNQCIMIIYGTEVDKK